MLSKTKILTLIVFGLLFSNLSAQDGFENDPVAKLPDDDRTFRIGLQFSSNLSWFKSNTDGYSSEGSKMGFAYGLSFEYFLNNNYLISSGVSIQNAVGKLAYRDVYSDGSRTYSSEVTSTYKPKYIEIPLLLKLRTNEIGYFTYYGLFGVKTGFNFKSSAESVHTYRLTNWLFDSKSTVSSSDASEHLNWINMALTIGGGIEYNISGNTSLILGVTFNNGFINQLDTKVAVLDNNGNTMIGGDGTAVYSEKDASANLNYLALNLGIFF